ncbi:MAG: diguanylate cyclase domain-containing protein, partial [Ilumatobacteraceae bacterium]
MTVGRSDGDGLAAAAPRPPGDRLTPPSKLTNLIEVMPIAVAVIDREGQFLYANHQAGQLFRRSPADLVGTSAFDHIDERDRDFASRMLTFAPKQVGVVGPALVRIVDADGTSYPSQLRSYDCSESLDIDGYVLTLTPESTHDMLVSALASLGPDDDVEHTLEAICRSAQGDPLGCHAAMLVPSGPATDPDEFEVVGDWLLPTGFVDAADMPWRAALAEGWGNDLLSTDHPHLDPALREAFVERGLTAAWVRPVFGPHRDVSAVFVLWRATPGPASPNQERFIDDALQFSRLAFDQVDHRRELERAARRDGLTGVANRRAFKERLDGAARSHDVLFIDLDHFKVANDTFGHDVGDQILTQVARRISNVIRAEDVLYRTGGDEFVVICQGVGMALDEHGRLAARIIERLSAPFMCDGHQVRVGATVGIATGTSRSLPDTVRAADAA